MPITTITQGASGPTLSVACIECGAEQKIEASALTLGTDHRSDVIAVPPCACGAQEFLQRTFDVHPVEHEAGHRKTVNALALHLKATGRVHPDHAAAIRAETKAPVQVGPLLGEVPDSSLPPKIVAKRRAALMVPATDPVADAAAVLAAAQAAYARAVASKAAS
jgi:hypothetical protein